MSTSWETANSRWQEEDGRFSLAATAGLGQVDWSPRLRERTPDLARLLAAALPQTCSCSAIYPEGFAFCPECGAPLHGLAASGSADWFGPGADQQLPRHVPHGLAVTSQSLAGLESRAAGQAGLAMAAPPNAFSVFAAGHFGFAAQRLLALAPARKVLQYWDPCAQQWQVLTPLRDSATLACAAAHAWLPPSGGARGDAGVIPTLAGLLRLWIDPLAETYRSECLVPGAAASGPARLRHHVGCLFNMDGELQLWSAAHDFCGQERQSVNAPLRGWQPPVAYDGQLLWLHEAGRLLWEPGSAARWRPWPEGWSPRLALCGPTQGRDGRLWLMGHGADGYSFLELDGEDEQVHVDGLRTGFAGLLFRRGHEIAGDPWDEANVEDSGDADALVLPLLRAMNKERPAASGIVLRCHGWNGRAEDVLDGRVLPRVSVEWIGRKNVVLDEIARLVRPQDCVPIFYDGTLWLHHPTWPRMRGWQLP